jgi:hypothetical protein
MHERKRTEINNERKNKGKEEKITSKETKQNGKEGRTQGKKHTKTVILGQIWEENNMKFLVILFSPVPSLTTNK